MSLERSPYSSSTVKRQVNYGEMNKSELLEILAYMQSELEAREIVIATLKAEKSKQLYYQAKYGRFTGTGDPFQALQRDSEIAGEPAETEESTLRPVYDNQLAQLEKLIASQRKAQAKMRDQISAMEKKYHKVLAELEEERRKHERDAAQGDDVLVMLEKERERLKSEVEYEKSQCRKLDKELKKVTGGLEEEHSMSQKQKQVAIALIKERRRLSDLLAQERRKSGLLEQLMREEKGKMKGLAEGLMAESKKSLQMEAALEKRMSELDVEREQLRGRLAKEEAARKEVETEVERLRQLHISMQASPSPSLTGSSQTPLRTPNPPAPNSATPHRQKPEPPVRRTPESSTTTAAATNSVPVTPSHIHQSRSVTGVGVSTAAVKLTVGPSPTTNRKQGLVSVTSSANRGAPLQGTPTNKMSPGQAIGQSVPAPFSRITPPSKLSAPSASSTATGDHGNPVTKGMVSHVCVNGK